MARPQRGEVWLVDLGYAAKTRPCLILSVGAEDQDRALVSLVSHTTSVRGSGFEVAVGLGFLREGAFDAQSLVTIPDAKLLKRLGEMSAEGLRRVESAIRLWLGLSKDE
jgi:mRNA interferase MazF